MYNAYSKLWGALRELRAHSCLEFEPPSGECCGFCGRSWHDVEDPGRAYPYRYGNTKSAPVLHLCTTCATVARQPLTAELGYERRAGTSGSMVPAKLGMLSRCAGVVSADDVLYVGGAQGWWPKFAQGAWAKDGRFRVASPVQLLLDLHRSGQLGPIKDGIVFIEEFGRKTDVLMADLILTTDLREVWFNTDAGATRPVDLAALIHLAGVMKKAGHSKKSGSWAFWAPIINASRGRVDTSALARWLKASDPKSEIAEALPTDPHTRQRLPRILPSIMEALS